MDLASPSPPPPPGSETHGIIVTGLQDIGQQPGLPPERHVFGIDEAPVFYLFGRTGRIAVSILRSGTDVYRPLAGTGSTAAPEPRRMAGYYLSAPLAPGTQGVAILEDPRGGLYPNIEILSVTPQLRLALNGQVADLAPPPYLWQGVVFGSVAQAARTKAASRSTVTPLARSSPVIPASTWTCRKRA